jgi:FkbM family methyltransferase
VSALSKARQIIEDSLDRIFPKRPVFLPAGARALLERHSLRIVDVGGAMGPDERWKSLGPGVCRFVTFEPDARSFAGLAVDPTGRNASLPVGLADTRGEKTLHLTRGEFASSLYPPNAEVLKDFATWPWHEPAGETTIRVDTLDHSLSGHPEWRPDFIKIDVEGADLDVLKGAVGCLPDVLGVQVEVAFVERNVGAPLQPEIDGWLRAVGFVPHQLIREHWVRANGLFGATSRPQLVWADALYLRDRAWMLAKLAKADGQDRAVMMARMIAVLLVYGAHDYALELVDAADAAGSLDAPTANELRAAVVGSVVSTPAFLLRGGIALTLALAVGVVLLPFGQRGRAVAGSIVAKQAAPVFNTLYRSAARAGLQASCIPDLP